MGQVRTVQRRARSTLCLALFALMAAAFALALPTQAFAKTVHKDGFDDMPGGTIQMQAPLFIDEASFSTTNPNIKRGLIADLKDTFGGTIWGWSDSCVIYYDGLDTTANTPSGTRSVTGSWSLKWENVGTDADGDAIDALLTMSDIEVRVTNTKGLDFVFADSTKGRNTFTVDMIGYANPSTYTDGAQMNLSLKMYKHGTTDIASGKYLMAFADIDVPSGYGSKWHEQVKLLGGFADDVYTLPSCTLDIGEDGTLFVSTVQDSENSLKSGFVVLGDPAGMSWRMAGVTGTDLFRDFGSSTVKATAGAGGKIDPSGSVKVAWHTDRTFKAVPAKGYHLLDLAVDGKSVGAKSAYTFQKVESDHTIHADFSPNAYAVAFDANGGEGSMDDMAMTYDKAKSLTPNSFAKVGYTFTGWNTEKDGSGKAYSDKQEVENLTAADGARVVLHAQWRPNEYTVVFDANDGDAAGDMGEQEFRYDAAQALRPCGYKLEGHTFAGWGTSPEGGRIDYVDRQVVKNLTAEDGGEVTLYAQWSIDTYPVVFTDGMGGELSRDEVPHKTSAKAPDEPVRTGYTFDGWDADFSCVTAPMTVNATWRANRYTVAFDGNGGRGHMDDQGFSYDEAQKLSGNAYRRAGYSFQGWSLDDDGAIAYTDRQTVKNLTAEDGGEITLYAVWDEDADVVVSYTASDPDHAELSNDSDELAPATGKPKGSTVTPAEGYRFDGWVDVSTGEKVGTSPAFAPSRGSDGLWHAATYEARIAPISYTVAFDANGGEGSMDGQAFAYDEEKPLDGCAFERTGYAFAGWAIEPGGDVAYDDAEVVSALASEDGATVTLYAVWAENPDVTIGYIADDPEHSTPSVSSETVAPATGEAKGSSLAVADGYAFDRWEDWAGTVVSEDPTIVPERGGKGLWRTSEYTAYVAPISYTVAFDANGGTGKMDDQQMTYDAAQALRKNAFERPGYIFLGWNTAPDGSATPFEDAQEVVNLASEEGDKVVLYAQWAKRTLAVTFYDGQGHIIETDTVPYGGKATAPSEPVRDGYAFVGWDTDFGCVTKDIDVTAMWKPVSDAAIAAEAASGSSAGPAPAGTAGATTPLDQTGDPGLALGFAAAALAAGAGSAFALRRKRASDGRGER